ncbi:MAG: alpha/beta fold hydrolase [Alphaproteobacteria bacterium]|nr:alpha/beta fold hydrolase [Alphaproteobacteria bacterium]
MFNHLKALEVSYDLQSQAAGKIKAPTLILQGEQDPIFPPDHGEALKRAIPHAHLEIIAGMGHGLNTHFYNVLIEKIGGISKQYYKEGGGK